MRLRNVPGAREVMVENEYVFTEPEGMKGNRHGQGKVYFNTCRTKSRY